MKNNNTIVKTAQESKDTNMTPNNIVARKEEQEKKYHDIRVNSLRRRCKALKLSKEETENYVKKLEEELKKPKEYSILMLFPKDNKTAIVDAITNNKIKYKIIGDEYGWLDGDEAILGKLRGLMPENTRIFPYQKKIHFEYPKKNAEEKKKPVKDTVSRKQKSKAKKIAATHHCTIPPRRVKITVYKNGNGEWKNPGISWKKKRKDEIKGKAQYFILRKGEIKHKRVVHLPKHSAWYMEQLVQNKLKKWERKNPKPILTDTKEEDMFKSHFLPEWEKKKEQATVNIRNFVISVYGKQDKKINKPVVKTIELHSRTKNKPEEFGEFWVRKEYFYRDPNTGEPTYKIHEQKINDKIALTDSVGQTRTNYEHSIDKACFVGMFKKDGKTVKAFLPKTGSLYKKFIGDTKVEIKSAA